VLNSGGDRCCGVDLPRCECACSLDLRGYAASLRGRRCASPKRRYQTCPGEVVRLLPARTAPLSATGVHVAAAEATGSPIELTATITPGSMASDRYRSPSNGWPLLHLRDLFAQISGIHLNVGPSLITAAVIPKERLCRIIWQDNIVRVRYRAADCVNGNRKLISCRRAVVSIQLPPTDCRSSPRTTSGRHDDL
jgi:hypothetical protein